MNKIFTVNDLIFIKEKKISEPDNMWKLGNKKKHIYFMKLKIACESKSNSRESE